MVLGSVMWKNSLNIYSKIIYLYSSAPDQIFENPGDIQSQKKHAFFIVKYLSKYTKSKETHRFGHLALCPGHLVLCPGFSKIGQVQSCQIYLNGFSLGLCMSVYMSLESHSRQNFCIAIK